TRTNYYALSKNTSTSRNTKANTVRKGYLNSWKHVSRNCRQKNSTPQRRRRKINSNDNAATKRARTVGHPNDCGSLRRVRIPSGSLPKIVINPTNRGFKSHRPQLLWRRFET